MGDLSPIRKLAGDDAIKSFDCGQVDLNTWLSTYAYPNQRSGMSTVFITTLQGSNQVVGYYALATGGVEHSEAPARVVKGIPRHPIPVILLTRLAVDTSTQGRGLGAALLRDALIRVSGAAD